MKMEKDEKYHVFQLNILLLDPNVEELFFFWGHVWIRPGINILNL